MKTTIITSILVLSTSIYAGGLNSVNIDDVEITNNSHLTATATNTGEANVLGTNQVGAGQLNVQQGVSGGSTVNIEDGTTIRNQGRLTAIATNNGDAENGGVNQVGAGQVSVQQAHEIASTATIEDTDIVNTGEIDAIATNEGDANGGANQVSAGQVGIQQ